MALIQKIRTLIIQIDKDIERQIGIYIIQCVKKSINRIGFQSHHMEKIWDNLDMIGYKNYSLNNIYFTKFLIFYSSTI